MTVAAERSDGAPPKTRIFVSYSRKDMAFADRLEVALKARGVEPLIDRSEIYAFAARLWDAETGKPIGEPLKGHVDAVCGARRSAPTASASSPRLRTRRRGCGTPTPASRSASRSRAMRIGCRSAAFSPDGKRIVTASADKTARLWDAETGKPIGEPLRGHADTVSSAAFSPDGKRIVTASDDKTARLWDAETGKPSASRYRGHERVRSAPTASASSPRPRTRRRGCGTSLPTLRNSCARQGDCPTLPDCRATQRILLPPEPPPGASRWRNGPIRRRNGRVAQRHARRQPAAARHA